MNRDTILRRLFIIGLPPTVPAVYRAFTALFIVLFAGAYAWLACHRPIIRPFVAFGAIGKASAFALVLALFVFGKMTLNSLVAFSGDLVLAMLFVWCLAGVQPAVQADAAAPRRLT